MPLLSATLPLRTGPPPGAPPDRNVFASRMQPATQPAGGGQDVNHAALGPWLIEFAKKQAGKGGNALLGHDNSLIAAGVIAGGGFATELAARYWPRATPPTATIVNIPFAGISPIQGTNPAVVVTSVPLTRRQLLAATQPKAGGNVQLYTEPRNPRLGDRNQLVPAQRAGRLKPQNFVSGPRLAVPVATAIPTGIPGTQPPSALGPLSVPKFGPGALENLGRFVRQNAYLVTLGEAQTQQQLVEKLAVATVTGGPLKGLVALFAQATYRAQHDLGLLPGPYLGNDPFYQQLKASNKKPAFSPVTDP